MLEAIDKAVAAVRKRSKLQPTVGVVLGSGLGNVVKAIDVETEIPYADIPGAKASTVMGHSGKMILGRAGNVPVVVLSGRMHFYEGHDMRAVVHLARVAAKLGIKKGNDHIAFHSSVPAESNQWYQFQVVDRTGYMLAGEALVDTLKNRSDPRLAQYFAGVPAFVGSRPGENNENATDLSDARLDPAFRQPLVTWRENQLIIAEAASKTGDDATALAALNAVRADVGLTPSALAGASLYAEIMTQKWIEDFQKVEVFQDYNRSCLPRLIPAPGKTAIPGRFLYPINERNSNPNIPAPSAQPPRNPNDPNACS